MRWTPGGTSSDIEDERGSGSGGGFMGGLNGGHLGIGGTIVLLILSFVFKQNLFTLFTGAPGSNVSSPADNSAQTSREQPEVQFISFVLDDIQKTWDQTLPKQTGVAYHHAKLKLFRDSVDSACGTAQSATGPFYCPEDEKVYVDLGFYDELAGKFAAPGQFAQAYVIAHEIGHHVQKLLGIEGQINSMEQSNPGARNQLSVRLELQADCLAGVWGHSTQQRDILDANDIPDGLRAAAAVGDDRLQKMATGRISPDTFTHGSSAQRSASFHRGLDSGDISACK